MQCERARGSWKDQYRVNVLCIVDQDHQRCAIGLWVTTPKMEQHLSPIAGKWKKKFLSEIKKNEIKKPKYSKNYRSR